jgi:hypothetical protein
VAEVHRLLLHESKWLLTPKNPSSLPRIDTLVRCRFWSVVRAVTLCVVVYLLWRSAPFNWAEVRYLINASVLYKLACSSRALLGTFQSSVSRQDNMATWAYPPISPEQLKQEEEQALVSCRPARDFDKLKMYLPVAKYAQNADETPTG